MKDKYVLLAIVVAFIAGSLFTFGASKLRGSGLGASAILMFDDGAGGAPRYDVCQTYRNAIADAEKNIEELNKYLVKPDGTEDTGIDELIQTFKNLRWEAQSALATCEKLTKTGGLR